MKHLNIGSLLHLPLILDNPQYLNQGYQLGLYDGLIAHPSNGGVPLLNQSGLSLLQQDEFQEAVILKTLNLGMTYGQILSNLLWEPDRLDTRLTRRLDLLQSYHDQVYVTVSTQKQLKWMRTYYPSLLIHWSITAWYRDNPSVKDIPRYLDQRNPNIVVVPLEHLDKVVSRWLPFVETIVLDECGTQCPFRALHYLASSLQQTTWLPDYPNFCVKIYQQHHLQHLHLGTLLGYDQLRDLENRGITRFKIASRNFVQHPLLREYLRYLLGKTRHLDTGTVDETRLRSQLNYLSSQELDA